jgi:hypothetical protein
MVHYHSSRNAGIKFAGFKLRFEANKAAAIPELIKASIRTIKAKYGTLVSIVQ